MGAGAQIGGPAGNLSPVPGPLSPRFRALPPLALYIHIPYCARKCPYCDFNSHEARGAVPEARYVAALVADLERALPRVWGRPVCSVFLGGGTPSLFSAAAIDALLAAVRARLPLASGAEVTLEANPGTFEAEKFRDFRAAGVNRLSIGVQSFAPAHLAALGRIHDGVQARRAIEAAQRDFDNVNIDLMYGLPGQSVEQARADLEQALAFAPAHLSCYHLTIEPNTYFHRFPPRLPDEDEAAAMQEAIEGRLAAAGYEHYEVSAFARRDAAPVTPHSSPRAMRCAHNLNYWQFGDYLGIGAGAHGKLSFAERIVRETRLRHPESYMKALEQDEPHREERGVAPSDVGFEFMMNALRLNAGFATPLFEQRTGMPLATVLRGLDAAERRGLLTRDHARVAPTAAGRRYLNDLLEMFLPDPAAGAARGERVSPAAGARDGT